MCPGIRTPRDCSRRSGVAGLRDGRLARTGRPLFSVLHPPGQGQPRYSGTPGACRLLVHPSFPLSSSLPPKRAKQNPQSPSPNGLARWPHHLLSSILRSLAIVSYLPSYPHPSANTSSLIIISQPTTTHQRHLQSSSCCSRAFNSSSIPVSAIISTLLPTIYSFDNRRCQRPIRSALD